MFKQLIEKLSALFNRNADDEIMETVSAVSEQPSPVAAEDEAELTRETDTAPEEELPPPPEDEQCENEETIPPEEAEEEEKVLICKGCGSKVSSKISFCQVCGEKVY